MKICTQIYGRTLIVLFVVCFSIHTRTNDNIQRRKIITRREVTYIHTHKQTNDGKKKKKNIYRYIYIYK
jgi:hypothetical protein